MKWLYIFLFLICSFVQIKYDPLLYPESKGIIVNHKSYVVCYDDSLKYTKWASYILTDTMVYHPIVRRLDNFRPDSLLKKSAQLSDYRYSGFDRGHLVNAYDMRFDSTSESESFYLSNMAPQYPSFNRGIWKQLENQTRKWVQTHKELYIITGGILRDSVKYIGNGVAVPSYFYKIILDNNTSSSIAFVIENKYGSLPLKSYAVSIDQIENTTNIDFFSSLEDNLEVQIESKIDSTWF
jgi:endonuclease G